MQMERERERVVMEGESEREKNCAHSDERAMYAQAEIVVNFFFID